VAVNSVIRDWLDFTFNTRMTNIAFYFLDDLTLLVDHQESVWPVKIE